MSELTAATDPEVGETHGHIGHTPCTNPIVVIAVSSEYDFCIASICLFIGVVNVLVFDEDHDSVYDVYGDYTTILVPLSLTLDVVECSVLILHVPGRAGAVLSEGLCCSLERLAASCEGDGNSWSKQNLHWGFRKCGVCSSLGPVELRRILQLVRN